MKDLKGSPLKCLGFEHVQLEWGTWTERYLTATPRMDSKTSDTVISQDRPLQPRCGKTLAISCPSGENTATRSLPVSWKRRAVRNHCCTQHPEMWGNQWILWDTHMCSIINGIADSSAKLEPALDSFKTEHLMRTSCMRHLTRFSVCYSFRWCLSKYTVETSQASSQATYTTSSNLTDIFVWTAHNWNWENVCELDRCYQSRQSGKIGTFPCCFQITHKFQCSFVFGLV